MFDLLFQNIQSKGVLLHEGEMQVIRDSFNHKKYRKGQYILHEGEIASFDNYIIKGLARTYSIDAKGVEHIVRFTPEDWWTGDLASFLSGKPTTYSVDCLENTEVLRITRDQLESLCDKVPVMNKYFRVLYQRSIISFNVRVSSNLSMNARERYNEFIKRFPEIHQRVPDKQIASYLGITPQSLSRIRNQFMEENR
jgi:CRP-like cAMP-binding protein